MTDYPPGRRTYTPPRIGELIPTPVTAWSPIPVVLTVPRLAKTRLAGQYVGGIGATFLIAWVLMLILGALHNDALPWLPPLGFWHTLLALIGLRLLQRTAPLWTLLEPRSQATQDMVKKLGGRR